MTRRKADVYFIPVLLYIVIIYRSNTDTSLRAKIRAYKYTCTHSVTISMITNAKITDTILNAIKIYFVKECPTKN